MKTQCIDVTNLNDFLGHDPRICQMCEHRQAALFMVLRYTHDFSRFTHHASRLVCLTCFELAEARGFDELVESVSPQRHVSGEIAHELVYEW